MSDLTESFVERLPKTTPGGVRRLEYRKPAPLVNATVRSLNKRIHQIEFELDGALTNDTLNISSKMCGESAVFHLR